MNQDFPVQQMRERAVQEKKKTTDWNKSGLSSAKCEREDSLGQNDSLKWIWKIQCYKHEQINQNKTDRLHQDFQSYMRDVAI